MLEDPRRSRASSTTRKLLDARRERTAQEDSNDASYFLTFVPNTQPLIAYAARRIGAAGLSVEAHDNILLINAPSSLLEAEAEKVKLERPLRTDKPLALSERDWPRREFSVAERDDFASPASFSPAESALLVGLLLDAVPTDDALPAAFAAAGVAAAPTHSRLLLHVLEAAGAVAAAAPLHDDGARDAAWRSSVRQLARGRLLDADVFAAGLGRGRRLRGPVCVERMFLRATALRCRRSSASPSGSAAPPTSSSTTTRTCRRTRC